MVNQWLINVEWWWMRAFNYFPIHHYHCFKLKMEQISIYIIANDQWWFEFINHPSNYSWKAMVLSFLKIKVDGWCTVIITIQKINYMMGLNDDKQLHISHRVMRFFHNAIFTTPFLMVQKPPKKNVILGMWGPWGPRWSPGKQPQGSRLLASQKRTPKGHPKIRGKIWKTTRNNHESSKYDD